jgi:hypothetical protein
VEREHEDTGGKLSPLEVWGHESESAQRRGKIAVVGEMMFADPGRIKSEIVGQCHLASGIPIH